MAGRCGLTWQEHVDRLMVAMMMVGMGGGCAGTYEALIEVAELIRQDQQLPVYQAQHTTELLDILKQKEAEMEIEERSRGLKVGRA